VVDYKMGSGANVIQLFTTVIYCHFYFNNITTVLFITLVLDFLGLIYSDGQGDKIWLGYI